MKKVKAVKPRKKYKKRAKAAHKSAVKAAIPPSRWALTADGAFVDLASPGSDEIPQVAARALVVFIRTLDRGEAAA